MSEAQTAAENTQKRITELRVSGHLMTLETGTFCIFHAPGSPTGSGNIQGLPGVRISLPPGAMENPDAISISTFRADGWLAGPDAAALIRVSSGPAQVLVTVYQAPGQGPESAPRLQVLRLSPEPKQEAAAPRISNIPVSEGTHEVLVHMQGSGDVPGRLGEWAGVRGSRGWIEGFSILPPAPLKPEDIEYQAVLGRGWLSPWVHGGQFCGSRGMALPLLGLRLRLKGEAAEQYSCEYSASFVDGETTGPLPAGEACEAESLSPLEAFQIVLTPRKAAKAPAPAAPKPIAAAKPATKAKPAPAAVKTPKKEAVTTAAKPAAKAKPVAKAKAPSATKRPGRPAR